MKPIFILCLALVLSGGFANAADISSLRVVAVAAIPTNAFATSKVKLKVVSVDSEETNGQDGSAKNAVDGDPNTYWHTQWNGASPGLPHEIIIELIPPSVIKGFAYLPRQDPSDHGTIKDYEFYVSNDGDDFGLAVKKGAFEPGKREHVETFAPVRCRFIKLKAISEITGQPWTSAAEIGVITLDEEKPEKPVRPDNFGLVVPTNSELQAAINKIVEQVPELGEVRSWSGIPSGSQVWHGSQYAAADFFLRNSTGIQPTARLYDPKIMVTITRYASVSDAQKDLEMGLRMRATPFTAKRMYKGATLYQYRGASGKVMNAICQSGKYIIETEATQEDSSPLIMKVVDVLLDQIASAKPNGPLTPDSSSASRSF